jgi:hypothetical protein
VRDGFLYFFLSNFFQLSLPYLIKISTVLLNEKNNPRNEIKQLSH